MKNLNQFKKRRIKSLNFTQNIFKSENDQFAYDRSIEIKQTRTA